MSVQLRADQLIPDEIVRGFDAQIESLGEMARSNTRKSAYIRALAPIHKDMQAKLLIPLSRANRTSPNLIQSARARLFAPPLNDEEKVYYDEAFRAAEANCFKAGMVMLWCGAISRLQAQVRKLGLTAFNATSIKIKDIKSGPYKYFNKEYSITMDNELQVITDSDLILIVSAMVGLDINQTEAILALLDTRNSCGHPSAYSVEEIHFAHFATEVHNLILSNPKL